MKLRGKVALVTGASRGLGKQAALKLAEQGADVILTYVRNQKAAFETKKTLEGVGVKAEAIEVNLTGSHEIEKFKEQLLETLANWGSKKFDFLINNAGISSESGFGQITEEEMDLLYETNYKSLVLLTQALEPLIRDGGRVITLGTGLTQRNYSPMVIYAAMKSAAETFTRYLASELGKRNITVNVVAPGGIDNDFNAKRFEQSPGVRDYLASNTALGRVGLSEDVGGVIAFLCTQDARWITGQRIAVNGGFKL